MSDNALTVHVSSAELDDYFLEVLSDEESREVERHLVACESCATLAMQLHRSWSALETEMAPAAWRESYLKDCVRRGFLAAAASLSSDVRAKFSEWTATAEGRVEGLVRVAKEGLKEAAGSTAELLFPDALFPVLAPAGHLGEAVIRREEDKTRSFVVLGAARGPKANVILEGSELTIRFEGVQKREQPPMVFLIPMSAPERTRILDVKWNTTHNEWAASGKAEGEDFLLAIGPRLEGDTGQQ